MAFIGSLCSVVCSMFKTLEHFLFGFLVNIVAATSTVSRKFLVFNNYHYYLTVFFFWEIRNNPRRMWRPFVGQWREKAGSFGANRIRDVFGFFVKGRSAKAMNDHKCHDVCFVCSQHGVISSKPDKFFHCPSGIYLAATLFMPYRCVCVCACMCEGNKMPTRRKNGLGDCRNRHWLRYPLLDPCIYFMVWKIPSVVVQKENQLDNMLKTPWQFFWIYFTGTQVLTYDLSWMCSYVHKFWSMTSVNQQNRTTWGRFTAWIVLNDIQ